MRPTPALIPRLITYVPHAPHPPAHAYAAAHAADGPMGRPYPHAYVHAFGFPSVGYVSAQHVKTREQVERNEDGDAEPQASAGCGMQMQKTMVRSPTLHPSLLNSHQIHPFSSGVSQDPSGIGRWVIVRSVLPLPGLVMPLPQH